MKAEAKDLQVFCGDVNEHSARVYVSSSEHNAGGRRTLRGFVRGPFAISGETLPAQFHLRDLPGDSLLAATIVTDPCFWTPLHPATYRVDVELCEDGKPIASIRRRLAIRPLGVRDQSLYSQGKRRVIRALNAAPELVVDLLPWLTETATTAVIQMLDPSTVSTALDSGAPLLLDARNSDDLADVLALVAQSPAVVAVLLQESQVERLSDDPRNLARATLFIIDLSNAPLPTDLPEWAELGLVSENQVLNWVNPPRYAVLVGKQTSGDHELRRAEIDKTQARLAAVGQFAGYAVID